MCSSPQRNRDAYRDPKKDRDGDVRKTVSAVKKSSQKISSAKRSLVGMLS